MIRPACSPQAIPTCISLKKEISRNTFSCKLNRSRRATPSCNEGPVEIRAIALALPLLYGSSSCAKFFQDFGCAGCLSSHSSCTTDTCIKRAPAIFDSRIRGRSNANQSSPGAARYPIFIERANPEGKEVKERIVEAGKSKSKRLSKAPIIIDH